MRLEKLNKFLPILLFLIFVVLFFATRLPRLSNDENNPDGVNWYERSERFVVALKEQRWADTYQAYHPGVTLMWVVGPAVEIVKQFVPDHKVINKDTFETFHLYSKTMLVFVQFGLLVICLLVFQKIFGYYKALLALTLFTLEPFVIGNSRIVHIDTLLTLFVMLAFGFGYLSLSTQKSKILAWISGVFIALAFLSKSIGILILPFMLIFGGYFYTLRYGKSKLIGYLVSIIGGFVLTVVLFFPALWVAPFFVIKEIFRESERVGGREGHGQIVFGEYTRDPGLLFYFLVLGLKSSLVGLLGFVFFFFSKFGLLKKFKPTELLKTLPSFTLYYGAFGLLYLLTMSVLSKKVDRYILVLFPLFSFLAVQGFYLATDFITTKVSFLFKPYLILLIGVFSTALFIPLITFFPNYFTFTNELAGTPNDANKIVAQKPFGVGVFALKTYINTVYSPRFGNYPLIGFYDVKPMRSIYIGSRIFDLQLVDPLSLDIIVVGPNESFPIIPIDRSAYFKLDYIYKINGLDFWKIYVKKR